VTIYKNNATQNGGVFYIATSDEFSLPTTASTMTIKDSYDLYENKARFGGFASIDNKYLTMTIKDSFIRNHTALSTGGFLNILNAAQITISTCQITDLLSPHSHGIYSTSIGLKLLMTDSIFKCASLLDYV
jgi:hypothetical protein